MFTYPAKVVFAFNLLAATAWLAPLPPFLIKDLFAYIVSPSTGKLLRIKNKSKEADPTTQISN